jgi:glycosyltransferase involved in cell wall biosynthesis/putative flippase GtrA
MTTEARLNRQPIVDIVVPVYNEEHDLEPSVRRLRTYLDEHFPYPARITIADNASIDSTWAIAQRLEASLAGVVALHLDQKGRGRALRTAWLASDAPVVAYMDVDLSTGLDALLPLVAGLLSGHSEIAIGSRLAAGARVTRGPKRELISRCYNLILRIALGAGFRDAQCGFKAVRADLARELLPLVEDQAWFFDTELLILAQRAGLRILEVPVDWVDDPDSRVDVRLTALADLDGVWRLLRHRREVLLPGPARRSGSKRLGLGSQVGRFAAIGLVSTAAYLGLYSLVRSFEPAALSNAVALIATTVGNTAANRRLTFGVRGRTDLVRDHLAGLAGLAAALTITTLSIGVLDSTVHHPSRATELLVLVGANALATVCRFGLLRALIARNGRQAATSIHLERTPS